MTITQFSSVFYHCIKTVLDIVHLETITLNVLTYNVGRYIRVCYEVLL